MITRLVYNNKAFKMINEYGYKFSSNEVTFNDITIDFTDCTIADIPFKYQEIQIRQAETEEDILTNYTVLFTGYLDEIELSEMKVSDEPREITLTLLSPLKMATKRNVSLIGTYGLVETIKRLIQPLIDDGFILKEIHVPDGQITTNFVLETVENCMNNIGFKRNIFWYINEKKEIYINSIDYLFGLQPAKAIKQDKKENGLLKIQPKIENIDYANVINFKNVRLIYSSNNYIQSSRVEPYPIAQINKIIKKGDIITFDNPIVIDEKYLRNYIEEQNDEERTYYNFWLNAELEDGTNKFYTIGITTVQDDSKYDKFATYGNITFSNDNGNEGEIILQRDNFYSNLVTGFKWNIDSDATITRITSDTALRYTTMRFMYSAEINKLKGIISDSGQIEKSIDYNEKWTSLPQLISYARSLMTQNSNVVNQVSLEYDINPNLKVGDIVEIDKPNFYIQGKFAVKDISYTFNNELQQDWQITLKSTDLISTYIDMFRPAEKEENQENINTVILSEFVEEQINEKHSIELEQSEHTLNFNL